MNENNIENQDLPVMMIRNNTGLNLHYWPINKSKKPILLLPEESKSLIIPNINSQKNSTKLSDIGSNVNFSCPKIISIALSLIDEKKKKN